MEKSLVPVLEAQPTSVLGPPKVPRKRKTALMPEPPDFSSIIKSKTLSIAEKRKIILEKLNLKKTKKKYATLAERKAASKVRRGERRAARLKVYKKYGIEPKKKGPKLTKTQKKEKRAARGRAKRGFMREMARANPDLAKKYGIDPRRFKL